MAVVRGEKETFEAAAQVEVTAGDTSRSLWLQRGDGGMPMPVKTSEGTLAVSYGYESLPLGFSLQLKKFTRGMNPGGMGDARFASSVRVLDEVRHIDQVHEISMNEPLVHGRYTFYQSGILPSGTGTVLTAACDPGLAAKYIGSIMTCVGTLIMFVTRAWRGKSVPARTSQTTTNSQEQYMRRAIAASLAFCLFNACQHALADGPAASAADQHFDWAAWRSLPVQDGGRQKPLDSLAWETWRLLANRVSFTDPQSKQSLDATAFYVATLLDSPTWEKKSSPMPSGKATEGKSQGAMSCTVGAAAKGCDKWDAMPLLAVDSLALRKLLGMAPDQKWIAPQELLEVKIESPKSHKPTSFMLWAEDLVFKQEHDLTPLEKQGVELFDHLRAYQDHRAGRRLAILPISDPEKPWACLDTLVRMDWDDQSDPSGAVREVCAAFARVRAAWLAQLPAEFNAASHEFLGRIRELGPQLGAYPPAADDRSRSGLQPLGAFPFRLGPDAGGLPLRTLAVGLWLAGSAGPVPARPGLLRRGHGGHAHRLFHAGDNFRPAPR